MKEINRTNLPAAEELVDVIVESARALNLLRSDDVITIDNRCDSNVSARKYGITKRLSGDDSVEANGTKSANGDSKATGDGASKERLIGACRTLISVLSGPTEILKNMALVDKHDLVTLQVINHFQIAKAVPVDGEKCISDLAVECGMDGDVLTRILRQAMTYHVFCEPKTGSVAHTSLSREIPRLAPLLTYQLEVCLPSALSLLTWLKETCSDVKDKHAAPFQIAHSTHDSWWEYAEKKPKVMQDYGRYMALITTGGPHDVRHVVDGFAWESLGTALVIDIGGADGYVGAALAQANPNLMVIVQDMTALKDRADASISPTLKQRVIFAPHSFFEPQNAIGVYADVFLLRHILHDWDDESCAKILRQLTACMKPAARIIVAEHVLSEPGSVDLETERLVRALDMQMMVQFGGKERTLNDRKDLFALADSRLELVACTKPTGSADSFLELHLATGSKAV